MENLDFCIREDSKKYSPITVDSIYYVFADENYKVSHFKIENSYVMVLVLNGSGTLNTGKNSFSLNSGDSLIFDASKNDFNYFCSGSAWNFWWFEFEIIDDGFINLPINKVFSHPLNESKINLCDGSLFALKIKNSKAASCLFSSLICLLEKDYSVKGSGYNTTDILKSADEYIRRNLSTVTVKSVAEHLKISERTLLNVFKSRLNISTVNYISRIKTDMARHMLLTTDSNIKKISESLGYNDQFIFSYAFKQRFKMSPREYRQKYS